MRVAFAISTLQTLDRPIGSSSREKRLTLHPLGSYACDRYAAARWRISFSCSSSRIRFFASATRQHQPESPLTNQDRVPGKRWARLWTDQCGCPVTSQIEPTDATLKHSEQVRGLTLDLGHADSSTMLGKREFKTWQGKTTRTSFVGGRSTCSSRRQARRSRASLLISGSRGVR